MTLGILFFICSSLKRIAQLLLQQALPFLFSIYSLLKKSTENRFSNPIKLHLQKNHHQDQQELKHLLLSLLYSELNINLSWETDRNSEQ